jgi:hypothetical protein
MLAAVVECEIAIKAASTGGPLPASSASSADRL